MSLDILNTMKDFYGIDKNTEKSTEELRVATKGPHEPFDKFYMRLRSLTVAAQIEPVSMDRQLVESIIGGVRSSEMSKNSYRCPARETLSSERQNLCFLREI